MPSPETALQKVNTWQPPAAADAWGSAVAPTAPRVAPHRRRYRELDEHRGIAVLILVVFNVYQFCSVGTGLFEGTPWHGVFASLDAAVPWLFVVTAFLLFEPIVRAAVDDGPRTTPRAFMSRRALRLLPVYYIAVLVVWFLRQSSLPGDWLDLVEHLTFTQVFDARRIFYTNGPAWAVSVLVYFDLLLAALWALVPAAGRRLTTRGRRIGALVAIATGLLVTSEVWKVSAFALGNRPLAGTSTVWFGPMANLDSFAVGMLVAVVVVALGEVPRLSQRPRLALRAVAAACIIGAFATRAADGWSAVFFGLECSVGFGCLVAAAVIGVGDEGPRRSVLGRTATWFGAIAYSLYLWHEPVQLALNDWHGIVRESPHRFWTDLVVIMAVSVATAWLSYLVIERPARRLSAFLRRPTPQTAAALSID